MGHALNSSLIANRLGFLRKERGLSRNKLVNELSAVSDQTISTEAIRQYESFSYSNRNAHPNTVMRVCNLNALADFFGVSTDYILGRTDIKSPDTSIRAIVEYTGLTEESVLYLHQLKIGDSEEAIVDNLIAILEHDPLFRTGFNPASYEMSNMLVDKRFGLTPQSSPDRKRQAQIDAQRKRRNYIQGISKALRKCPVYTINAINTLLSNNNQLHLLEEIGKFISADPEVLNNRYPTNVSQTSTHNIKPTYITGDTKPLLLERQLSIIVQKLEQLREIAASPTE